MIGRVYLEWHDDELSSVNSNIQLSEEEYIEMLNKYCGLNSALPTEMNKVEKTKKYVSCVCDICDARSHNSMTVDDFFNMVYDNGNTMRYLMLSLDYDKMDDEFESEVKEWIRTTQKMFSKGIREGHYLPKMSFELSFINNAQETVYFELCDSFLVSNEKNNIVIGVPLIRLLSE